MMGKISKIVAMSRYYGSLASPELKRLVRSLPRKEPRETMEHLSSAARWLCAAQDAFDDGGVARSYSLIYQDFFKRKGWIPSYPETTGYIIPTVFDYAALTDDNSMRKRAVKMADWECEVQMKSGAVQGGTIDTPRPTPAVFNTGQVIFGWLRAYEETEDKKYLDSAVKAAEYLLKTQDSDGAWRKNLTDFATDSIKTYTYNVRVAWTLIKLSIATGDTRYRDGAVLNLEHGLGQQLDNGWFENDCLYNPSAPLLHTLAYTIRGILEAGVLLDKDEYIEKACLAADALMKVQAADGGIPGRLDRDWKGKVDYVCLTGLAQTGIICGRLYEITGSGPYLKAMQKANGYLKCVQILDTGNSGLDGGISGSFPLGGIYGRYEVLNWAVKFFMDSLMLEEAITTGTARKAQR